MNCGLVGALDNPQVPINCIAQYTESFLIRRTVVCGDRLCDAVELDQNGALAEAALIHLGREPPGEDARAGFLERGSGKLGIGGESLRVVNGTICGNPVRFGHGKNDRCG